jgi:N-acetylglucosaminyl-diphospho-decaprenol L-rhamnosyltransferase
MSELSVGEFAAARHTRRGERTPVVSVCIVNRNCRELLHACLASLLDQPQGVALEVIVVDNGSTDGAADHVENAFPSVRLIRNTRNEGFSRANNQAAACAKGDHLFFLNNDTAVPPGALAELVSFQEAHPDVWLIGPRLIGGDGQVQRGPRKFPTLATFLHRTCLFRWTGLFRRHYQRYCRSAVDEEQTVEVLMGAALFVRRERFVELGGWDEDFFFGGEDMELCRRAGQRGKVVHVPHVEVLHHGRASTRLFIGEASTHILIGFVRFLRKQGTPRAGLLLYKAAVTIDLPLQIGLKVSQLGWRWLRGQRAKAGKCWNDLKGLAAFLVRGLWRFWLA